MQNHSRGNLYDCYYNSIQIIIAKKAKKKQIQPLSYTAHAQKMRFLETADSVTYTEKILDGKLPFLCFVKKENLWIFLR